MTPPRTCLASLVTACGRWRVHVSPAGQATAEYTVVLALVAAALAGAGAAAGVGGVGEAVAGVVRTGICIVGGDVCRDSDARAAGLMPCTVGDRARGGGGAVTVLSLRIGRGGTWTVATRSDGSVVVTRVSEGEVGIAAGFGAAAGPLRLELGADGRYSLVFTEGRAWEFPDAAAAGRFLAAGDEDATPPTWRFGDVGNEVVGEAGVQVGVLGLTGVEASAKSALGARTGRGRTTIYARVRVEGPGASVWLPGHRRRAREAIVELTREHGSLRELAFRTVEPGAGDGEIVETVGRLDLRVPANRDAAGRLLGRRLPWPPAVMDDLRSLVRRTVQTGIVERAVYAVDDDSGGLGVSARMGLELGVDVERLDVERRLVAASAWTDGSQERERVDCVTIAAARRTS